MELRQHAARARPAARHGHRRRRRAALPRAGEAAAPERDRARLRGLRRVRPHGRRRPRSTRRPTATAARRARNVCTAQEPPSACDDGPFGKGKGGQLRYARDGPRRRLADALDRASPAPTRARREARAELAAALRDPAGALAAKVGDRGAWGNRTRLSLPGDRRLQDAVDWGKQNLLDLTRSAEDLQIRWLDQGNQYPAPAGTVPRARWVGAGFPDYPWLFATDGEYTAFASVAMGQFEADQGPPRRAPRRLGDPQRRSGIVTHEVISDGSNWFGKDQRQRQDPEQVRLQHRRDGQVPERRGAGLALDGRRPVPRRAVRLRAARDARGRRPARRGRRRLARGLGQRRARRHGGREARQLRLPDPRPLRPRRPGAVQARPCDRRRWATGSRPPPAPALRGRPGGCPPKAQYADSIDDAPVGGANNASRTGTGSASRRWRPS